MWLRARVAEQGADDEPTQQRRPRLAEAFVIFKNAEMSQSLKIGLAILRTFTSTQPVLGIAEIADQIKVSRSTTHRYVVTHVALGFLEQVASRKYRLAPRVADLGMSALDSTGLRGPALPYLADLRRRVGYTVSLAVLDGLDIRYVARAYSHRRGQYEADLGRGVGSRMPANCAAMGKVLVAGLPEQERRDWIRTTELTRRGPNSIVKKRLFSVELDRACHEGIAVNDQELVAGMVAVAAPLNTGDTVKAAIGIAASSAVISAAELADTCRADLLATVRELGSHLRYKPPTKRRTK
jgi:IclR family transcriptional regulator, pca regulon regulatory protein